MRELKKEKNDIDPEKFVCVKTDGTIFNFNKFKNSLDLASNIYRDKGSLKDAENEQNEIKILLNKLRKYNPTKTQEVTGAFKAGIFPYEDGFQKEESEEESEAESKDDFKKFIEYIENESKGTNYDLFGHYFNFSVPSALAKQLYETKNKNKNSKLVKEIKNTWSNLKDEVEKMSEDEKENEQPDKIFKIVENILEFNGQQGQGLKILSPNQMLRR